MRQPPLLAHRKMDAASPLGLSTHHSAQSHSKFTVAVRPYVRGTPGNCWNPPVIATAS